MTLGLLSIKVTFLPFCQNASVSSIPMYPAPTTTTFLILSLFANSTRCCACWNNFERIILLYSMPGILGSIGYVPPANTNLSYESVNSSPVFRFLTTTSFLSLLILITSCSVFKSTPYLSLRMSGDE